MFMKMLIVFLVGECLELFVDLIGDGIYIRRTE